MKIIELISGYKLIDAKPKYYLYYRAYGHGKKWCLIPQPENGKLKWFETEDELLNSIR